MASNTKKQIIKNLATAPALAARETLKTLTTEEERAEALRIFSALGITPAEINPARAYIVNVFNAKTGGTFARWVFPDRITAERCADSYNATDTHRASLQPVTGQTLAYIDEKQK